MGKRNRRRRRWEDDDSEAPASLDEAGAADMADADPEDSAPVATAAVQSESAAVEVPRPRGPFLTPSSAAPARQEPDAFAIDEDEGPQSAPAGAGIAPAHPEVPSGQPRALAERLPHNAGMQAELPPRPAPPVRAWTREPVLLALLLVGLIVLCFDTYFTIRLTGLSDRLNAMAAKPAALVAGAGDRPWVGPESIRTAAFAAGGQPITTLHIVNSGRAPAMDLRSNTVGSLRSAATPPPTIPATKGPLANTAILFPNAGGDLTFFSNTRALTADEVSNIQSGQYVLWLAGRLDYRDGRGADHTTTFRYRYDPKLASFTATPSGNAAN
jgi:hypothetical protein